MRTIDIRSHIYNIISSLPPLDDLEDQHIRFTLDWIDSGAELFRIEKPAVPDTHLVSYCLVVSPEMDKVLLADHKKAELWLPTGGHVDPGEDPKNSATREAREELGTDFEFLSEQPLMISVTKTVGNIARHTDISLWYVLKGYPDAPLEFDPEEFHQIRWFGLDEIPFDKADPQMKRFVQKLQLYAQNCHA